jgi:hypothetical protein
MDKIDRYKINDKLQEVLSSKEQLPLQDLKQLLFDLKTDCRDKSDEQFNALYELKNTLNTNEKIIGLREEIRYYDGEVNAFQITLDLLEHLENTETK